MQLSELYRQGVVVPLSDDALRQLRTSDVEQDISVKHAEIGSEEDFDWLWENDFFSQINERVGSALSDYEDEELAPSAVGIVESVARAMAERRDAPDGPRRFCTELAALCVAAAERGYPLFFVL